MTRIQLACYTLIASSFIVLAMLFVQASKHMDQTAHAGMLNQQGNITLISADIGQDTDAIYALDAQSGVMVAYALNFQKQLIERLPDGQLNIGEKFEIITKKDAEYRAKRRK